MSEQAQEQDMYLTEEQCEDHKKFCHAIYGIFRNKLPENAFIYMNSAGFWNGAQIIGPRKFWSSIDGRYVGCELCGWRHSCLSTMHTFYMHDEDCMRSQELLGGQWCNLEGTALEKEREPLRQQLSDEINDRVRKMPFKIGYCRKCADTKSEEQE